jgi:hypothetical protein
LVRDEEFFPGQESHRGAGERFAGVSVDNLAYQGHLGGFERRFDLQVDGDFTHRTDPLYDGLCIGERPVASQIFRPAVHQLAGKATPVRLQWIRPAISLGSRSPSSETASKNFNGGALAQSTNCAPEDVQCQSNLGVSPSGPWNGEVDSSAEWQGVFGLK